MSVPVRTLKSFLVLQWLSCRTPQEGTVHDMNEEMEGASNRGYTSLLSRFQNLRQRGLVKVCGEGRGRGQRQTFALSIKGKEALEATIQRIAKADPVGTIALILQGIAPLSEMDEVRIRQLVTAATLTRTQKRPK